MTPHIFITSLQLRDLMSRSKDDRIVSEALTVVVDAYQALARRAERAKDNAKASSLLCLLCACQWLSDITPETCGFPLGRSENGPKADSDYGLVTTDFDPKPTLAPTAIAGRHVWMISDATGHLPYR